MGHVLFPRFMRTVSGFEICCFFWVVVFVDFFQVRSRFEICCILRLLSGSVICTSSRRTSSFLLDTMPAFLSAALPCTSVDCRTIQVVVVTLELHGNQSDSVLYCIQMQERAKVCVTVAQFAMDVVHLTAQHHISLE